MKKNLTYRPAALAVALLAVALLGGCGPNSNQPAAPAARPDPNLVTVNAEMARNFKVQPLAVQTLDSMQEITGRIEANDLLVTRIGASVTGRVTDVLAEGDEDAVDAAP